MYKMGELDNCVDVVVGNLIINHNDESSTLKIRMQHRWHTGNIR